MGRIRTIKPEFPQSESIGRCSRDARLLFIQLWTIVDDKGRARAASRMLASLLYPYDDDAPGLIEGWLQDLEANDMIVRYENDGSSYLEIRNWLKHQKIDHASASKFPGPDDDGSRGFARAREHSRGLAPDQGPRTIDQGKIPATVPAAPKLDLVVDNEPRPAAKSKDFDPKSECYHIGKRLWKDRGGAIIGKLLKGIPPGEAYTLMRQASEDFGSDPERVKSYLFAVLKDRVDRRTAVAVGDFNRW